MARPEGEVVEYALWFNFLATNNKMKYEALIIGLTIAKKLGVMHLTTFNDSRWWAKSKENMRPEVKT